MDWIIESKEDEDYIRFIAPSGYKFDFKTTNDILSTISTLADRNVEFNFTKYFERFEIDGEGNVLIIESDPWLNKGFAIGAYVCNTNDFAKVLIKYISKVISGNSAF